jgi:hypothetical protein
MPKTKKYSIRWYQKRCDEEFSQLVRSREVCDRCGKTESLACAHIIPRTNHTLRWDIMNALCLCYSCHIFYAHKDPLGFVDYLMSKYPERMVYLQENRNKILKRTTDDYIILLKNLENRNIKSLVTFRLDK